MIFGCSHRNASFPRTDHARAREIRETAGCYVVCLDSGAEFAYDFSAMRRGRRLVKVYYGCTEQDARQFHGTEYQCAESGAILIR